MRYAILAVAVFVTGCVPVTEPLGDIDKAEPDKALVGEWTDPRDNAKLTIDVPAVKGYPKGLMRAVETDPKKATWFFTTKVGKHTYANIILGEKGWELAQFAEAGAFEKWQKEKWKWYFVMKYATDGDTLAGDGGNLEVVGKLMSDEKIGKSTQGLLFAYDTPSGWLAKYLDKNDPATIFDGSNAGKWQKAKKK